MISIRKDFVALIGNQSGYGSCLLADNPGRGQGHTPTRMRVRRLDAVEVIVGLPPFADPLSRRFIKPAFVVLLDPPVVDLSLDGFVNLLLDLLNFLRYLFSSADEMDRCPGEKGANGTEIRPINITAEDSSFERNASSAAEGIPDPWDVTEPALSQFLNQFLEAIRLRSKMGVDFLPCLFRWTFDLLRSHAIGEFFVVTHPVEGPALHMFPVFPARRFLPLPFVVLSGEIEFPFRFGGVLINLGCGDISPAASSKDPPRPWS